LHTASSAAEELGKFTPQTAPWMETNSSDLADTFNESHDLQQILWPAEEEKGHKFFTLRMILARFQYGATNHTKLSLSPTIYLVRGYNVFLTFNNFQGSICFAVKTVATERGKNRDPHLNKIIHRHFNIQARFNKASLQMPRPPNCLGRQTGSHLTLDPSFASGSPLQRKALHFCSIFLITFLGNKKS